MANVIVMPETERPPTLNVGGFLITGKMLNLFRRKEDPDDFFGYYAVPAAVSRHMFIAFGLFLSLSLTFSILCCCY